MSSAVTTQVTELQNYINGAWRRPSSTEFFDVTNPATTEFWRVHRCLRLLMLMRPCRLPPPLFLRGDALLLESACNISSS